MLDSTFNGINFKVVFPKTPNKKREWVWRARFWGHEPQTDIALLERGFHLVYIEVDLTALKLVKWRLNYYFIFIHKAVYKFPAHSGLELLFAFQSIGFVVEFFGVNDFSWFVP